MPILYQMNVVRGGSQRGVSGGASRYRIGIGFVGIVDVLIIFVSSKIALPLETSSKFRQCIFMEIDQNCAPVRSIRKNLIICE